MIKKGNERTKKEGEELIWHKMCGKNDREHQEAIKTYRGGYEDNTNY